MVVITSSATSGDVLNIGNSIFQLFPSDVLAADLLFTYISRTHRTIAILKEQNEYPVMMERSMRRANEKAGAPLKIVSEEFVHGQTDLKTTLLRLTRGDIDGLFINANSDESFIAAVRQIKATKFHGTLLSAYLPASETTRKVLGSALNGAVFVNLPLADDLVTESGRALLLEFRKRFGEPQAGFPVVPLTFEAFRVLDLAISSGRNPTEFLRLTKFSGGFVPNFHFDEHGAVQGINFQMQKVENGKVVLIKD